jgi:CDP-diacylglycerol---glycerol-3-phosphate 3-phosphatidyltransferase
MDKTVQAIKHVVRTFMRRVAVYMDRWSHGRITPNGITIFGAVMHIPIALLIASGHPLWASVLLVVFGLFDTLDGELARLQGRASVAGMLLDASTDRMKEVLLYTGAGYYLSTGDHPAWAAWAVAACGAALCVSYVKAKGEAAIASSKTEIPHAILNRMFADGLLTFEMRMAVLIVGLISGYIGYALAGIAVLGSYTAVQRLVRISRKL